MHTLWSRLLVERRRGNVIHWHSLDFDGNGYRPAAQRKAATARVTQQKRNRAGVLIPRGVHLAKSCIVSEQSAK
jgi:hypothetical protein